MVLQLNYTLRLKKRQSYKDYVNTFVALTTYSLDNSSYYPSDLTGFGDAFQRKIRIIWIILPDNTRLKTCQVLFAERWQLGLVEIAEYPYYSRIGSILMVIRRWLSIKCQSTIRSPQKQWRNLMRLSNSRLISGEPVSGATPGIFLFVIAKEGGVVLLALDDE